MGVLEKTLESPLGYTEIQPVHLKGNKSWMFIGRTDAEAGNSNTLGTWCEDLTHWRGPWCWERLMAGGEGDDRGWDGWMASLIQWAWVWVISRSSWWTERPGMLQSMGLQRVRQFSSTELNWTELNLQRMAADTSLIKFSNFGEMKWFIKDLMLCREQTGTWKDVHHHY